MNQHTKFLCASLCDIMTSTRIGTISLTFMFVCFGFFFVAILHYLEQGKTHTLKHQGWYSVRILRQISSYFTSRYSVTCS